MSLEKKISQESEYERIMGVKTEKPTGEIFYESSRPYAITLTLHNSLQSFEAPRRFRTRINLFRNVFRELETFCKEEDRNKFLYQMYIELSEPRIIKPDTGSRIHLHGLIFFKNNRAVKKFLINANLLSRLGYVDIDTCEGKDNLEKWFKYCTKQQEIIDEPPITNTGYDLFKLLIARSE